MMGTPSTTSRSPLRASGPAGRADVIAGVDLGTWSSVVTLFCNQQIRALTFDPAVIGKLRAGLADLLGSPELRSLDAEIRTELAEIAQQAAELRSLPPFRSLDELIGHLGTGDDPQTSAALTRATAVAVERLLGYQSHSSLRATLALRLHRMYDTAFDQPALRVSHLWPMPINRYGTYEVTSILSVPREGDITDGHLLDDTASVFTASGIQFPGMKRWLNRVQPVNELMDVRLPDGWLPESEVLLGQAVHDLVRRVETDVLGNSLVDGLDLPGARLRQFVATYPTTLAPQAKERMRRFVRDSLGCLDCELRMSWDEAVGSGMYFVMRTMAGFREAGLDAFRHRARPLPGMDGRGWRQHMLIIDIGGGTTDIALLAIDLFDRTARPRAGADDEPETQGREYELKPQVLGTTGHPQLGGDLLTLRMFYWLKAAIADVLHADHPQAPFVPKVIGSRSLNPVPLAIRQALRDLVPTHHKDASHGPALTLRPRTASFEKLWTEVENGKANPVDPSVCQDAGGRKFRLSEALVKELPDTEWSAKLAAHTGDIELTADEFGSLLRPIVEVAAGLAADLVRRSLGDDPDARLDIVALSGRTTNMPGVDRIVADTLAQELARADGGRPVAWDPGGIVVERTHAKQAASIGATWAAGGDAYNPGECDFGRDVVRVDVGNLLATLPVDLGLAGPEGKSEPVLRAGTPFDMADPSGRFARCSFTRSRWRRLSPLTSLHRILASSVREDIHSMMWGVYGHDRDEANSGTVWFQIQVDQELTPKLLLCKGTADGVRPWLHPDEGAALASVAKVDLRSQQRLADHFDGQKLVTVPRIEAVRVGDTAAAPVELFAAGPAEQALTCAVPTDGGAQRAWDAGLAGDFDRTAGISAAPLPITAAPDRYRLVVDGIEIEEDLEPPAFLPGAGPGMNTPYWVVLDDRGVLRVHAGYPAYLATDSLKQMRACPGVVHVADMEEGDPMWDPRWDPFTGDH
ncbi:hypothetical protein JOF56_005176 [Kibdelosporangium banguiense]|uniref:Molecular chaperone n=1 Tax=Kibdelosporangium banguiense TaxID=1365924 RepID=A0ABS4TLN3_9PSEU|nr:hypothetical protein [Kibdelosporangium banguiense]MBP2324791.1 hypothetical protein [Kibdelosporangium banguiense]